MITLPVVIEGIVALLLLVTLAFCILLERRLRSFRAGEASLRALVAELAVSTGRAEEAVRGLGETTRQAEAALDHRIGEARALVNQLAFVSRDGAGPHGRRSRSGHPTP
jgi:hypothetical protein